MKVGGTTGNLRGVKQRESKGSPGPLSCHRISDMGRGHLGYRVAKRWAAGGWEAKGK